MENLPKTIINVSNRDIKAGYVQVPSDSSFNAVRFVMKYTQTNYNIPNDSVLKLNIATVNIPKGNYSMLNLCYLIQTALVAVDASFTCSYDATTAKITIARATNFTILGSTSTKRVLDLIGFEAIDYSGNFTYTGPFVAKNYVGVGMHVRITGINFTTMIANDSGSVPSASFIVPWTTFGTIVNYESPYPFIFACDPNRTVRAFRIEIVDIDNQPIDFNGGDVILSIVGY